MLWPVAQALLIGGVLGGMAMLALLLMGHAVQEADAFTRVGGGGQQSSYAMAQDADGNVLITGSSSRFMGLLNAHCGLVDKYGNSTRVLSRVLLPTVRADVAGVTAPIRDNAVWAPYAAAPDLQRSWWWHYYDDDDTADGYTADQLKSYMDGVAVRPESRSPGYVCYDLDWARTYATDIVYHIHGSDDRDSAPVFRYRTYNDGSQTGSGTRSQGDYVVRDTDTALCVQQHGTGSRGADVWITGTLRGVDNPAIIYRTTGGADAADNIHLGDVTFGMVQEGGGATPLFGDQYLQTAAAIPPDWTAGGATYSWAAAYHTKEGNDYGWIHMPAGSTFIKFTFTGETDPPRYTYTPTYRVGDVAAPGRNQIMLPAYLFADDAGKRLTCTVQSLSTSGKGAVKSLTLTLDRNQPPLGELRSGATLAQSAGVTMAYLAARGADPDVDEITEVLNQTGGQLRTLSRDQLSLSVFDRLAAAATPVPALGASLVVADGRASLDLNTTSTYRPYCVAQSVYNPGAYIMAENVQSVHGATVAPAGSPLALSRDITSLATGPMTLASAEGAQDRGQNRTITVTIASASSPLALGRADCSTTGQYDVAGWRDVELVYDPPSVTWLDADGTVRQVPYGTWAQARCMASAGAGAEKSYDPGTYGGHGRITWADGGRYLLFATNTTAGAYDITKHAAATPYDVSTLARAPEPAHTMTLMPTATPLADIAFNNATQTIYAVYSTTSPRQLHVETAHMLVPGNMATIIPSGIAHTAVGVPAPVPAAAFSADFRTMWYTYDMQGFQDRLGAVRITPAEASTYHAEWPVDSRDVVDITCVYEHGGADVRIHERIQSDRTGIQDIVQSINSGAFGWGSPSSVGAFGVPIVTVLALLSAMVGFSRGALPVSVIIYLGVLGVMTWLEAISLTDAAWGAMIVLGMFLLFSRVGRRR